MIQQFLITVLFIYGVHASTRDDMLLDFLRSALFYKCKKPLDFDIRVKLSKVLFDCTPCMASLYGTISFVVFVYPEQALSHWPVWVFSLSGFNYLLNKILNK